MDYNTICILLLTTLLNFPSVIFMYNVGAIQEVAYQISGLKKRTLVAEEKMDFLQSAAKEAKVLFEREASEKAVQEARLQETEAEAADHAFRLEESTRMAAHDAEKLKEKLEFDKREAAHELEAVIYIAELRNIGFCYYFLIYAYAMNTAASAFKL